jgi:predicted negative regulator of RcsB-dependent stress response
VIGTMKRELHVVGKGGKMFEFIMGLLLGAAGMYIWHIWVTDKAEERTFEEEAQLIKIGAEMSKPEPKKKTNKKKTNKKKKKK